MIRLSSLLLSSMLVACTGGEEEESPEAHACEVVGDAGAAVIAAEDRAAAPAIEVGEAPYTVTLVSGAAAYVAVEVTEETEALLFAGEADIVTSLFLDDVEQTLPAPAPNELCAEDIPEHFDLDLTPGTWNIGVGPAGATEVWLLLHSAEGHAH
jgi:hypothetical protein